MGPYLLIANAVLDTVSNAVREWIDSVPQTWLIVAIALLGVLLVFGLVKKLVWLAAGISLVALVVGGLWMISGQTIG